MSVLIRTACANEIAQLLSQLDEQFIFGRGRAHSLRIRFPSVFCADNAHDIYLCVDDSVICSALAVRRFDWLDRGQSWRGAMIGAVYSDPARRGEGHASRTLAWAERRLQQQGVDFGVLWTAQPDFYARLGWKASDCGMFGELAGTTAGGLVSIDTIVVPIAEADVRQLEQIRQQWCSSRMPRRAQDYFHIPLPADSIEAFCWKMHTENSSYALVGRSGQTGIVYEMVGSVEGFSALLAEARTRYRHLLVNDCKNSASFSWLSSNSDIKWQDKPLAMWRPWSGKLGMEAGSDWYIPYFDRI